MEARDMKSFGVILSAFLFFARASVKTMSSCCHRVLCSVERLARLHRWPHDVEPVEPAPTKSSRRSAGAVHGSALATMHEVPAADVALRAAGGSGAGGARQTPRKAAARSRDRCACCRMAGSTRPPTLVEQLVHGCAALYIDLLKVKNDEPDWTGLPPPPTCWEDVERALDIEIVYSTSLTVIGKAIKGLVGLRGERDSK